MPFSPSSVTNPREIIVKSYNPAAPTNSAFESVRLSKHTITSGDPYQLVGTPLTPQPPKTPAVYTETAEDETLHTAPDQGGIFSKKIADKAASLKAPISVEIKRSSSKKRDPKKIINSLRTKVIIKGSIPKRGVSGKNVKGVKISGAAGHRRIHSDAMKFQPKSPKEG